MGIETLDHRTLADRAFERLEAAIVKGELAPGAKLSEVPLARSLGISRGPVREAMRRLEGRKLIRRIPHVGVEVASLSSQELGELLVVREALEGIACRLATENMTAGELEELELILHRHSHSDELRRGKAYYQQVGDLDFHYRIAQGCGNGKIVALLCDELYHQLRVHRFRSSSAPGRPQQALEEHRGIVRAMRARDPDLAESLMRAHIRQGRDIFWIGAPRPTGPATVRLGGARVSAVDQRERRQNTGKEVGEQ